MRSDVVLNRRQIVPANCPGAAHDAGRDRAGGDEAPQDVVGDIEIEAAELFNRLGQGEYAGIAQRCLHRARSTPKTRLRPSRPKATVLGRGMPLYGLTLIAVGVLGAGCSLFAFMASLKRLPISSAIVTR